MPETGQVISIEHANRFRLPAEIPRIESHIDLLELQGTNLVVSDLRRDKRPNMNAWAKLRSCQFNRFLNQPGPLFPRGLGRRREPLRFFP